MQKSALPRTLMKSWKWPSDHLPVVADVTTPNDKKLTFATWNVADSEYFGRFWPDAMFGFDWQPEDARLCDIMTHVAKLMEIADVIGLQEVPSTVVPKIVQMSTTQMAEVQWVAAPSDKDEDFLKLVAGYGCTSNGLDEKTIPPESSSP